MTPLRDYQTKAVEEAVAGLAAHGSVLFICPTGGGKTFILADLANHRRPHGRVLYISDRDHLIHQTAGVIRERSGLSVGIEQGSARVNRRRLPDVTCATIQSLRRNVRLQEFKRSAFATILIDEADLSVAESYQVVLDHFVGAKVFGCTATPDRADRKSLSPNFATTITEVSMADLIDRGFLSPVRRNLVRIDSVDLSPLRTHHGDFSGADIQRIFTNERALHEVASPVVELSGNRQTLVFSATVRQAQRLADVLNRYCPGRAGTIHGKMSPNERQDILCRFTSGELRYLCSCALLLRGVDLPFVSCVAMARPTKSRALYCQSMGRGTRICPGKEDLLVLDFTDNSLCHDLVCAIDVLATESPEVRLHAKEILDQIPGGNPQDAIRQAKEELEDPSLRAAILARVEYHTRSIDSRRWIDWDSQPLGKMPDVELARLLGVTATAVGIARNKRGIPGIRKKKKNISWSADLFGKSTDSELAHRLGVSKGTVSIARKRLGLKKLSPDFIDWDCQPLGSVPDAELADSLGVHSTTVNAARNRRGIAPANPWARNSKAKAQNVA